MPAVNYDYNYSRNSKGNQGVAKKARSISATVQMSAQQKVSSNTVARKTQNLRNLEHKNVAHNSKKSNNTSIDIPVVVKKKVVLQKPEELHLTKPKAKAKSKKKTETAKKSIIATVIGFTALFFICMRYAHINELTNKISSLEKELSSAESLNQQLSAEVDSKTDLNYIEKYAKYQLGMQKPDEKQIVRIPYDKQDKISTPIVISEDKEPSFFEKLFNDLKNLID